MVTDDATMTFSPSNETEFATLGEIHRAALERLEPAVADFLEGGAGDEETLDRNRSAFARWALRPRVMSGNQPPSLATRVMGIDLSLPILIAPFGGDGLFHPDGHKAVAVAARDAGVLNIVPELGTYSIEAVRAAAPGSPMLAQLQPFGTDDVFRAMLRRYAAAGFQGLCVTCDTPAAGWRERNHRNRFAPSLNAFRGNYAAGGDTELEEILEHLLMADEAVWSWDRLGALLAEAGLAWMAKGIMTGDDAVAAVEAGASAVLVSNHGGRQLDGVDASLDALAEVADAVGDRVDIAFDSGIRRGSDIVKALALGADAVVIGRLAVYGLAAGGAAGIGRVLDLLAGELRAALTLLGRGGVTDIDRSAIRPAGGGR